jgi:protoporphyrinogen oxidase
MPIKDLMNNLKGADPEVVRLSNTLEYRDFITVGILAKKLLVKNESDYPTINNIIPDNRLYIHDEGTTVGRIQIFNNWSPYLVKDKDTIWIGLEYFCNKEEEIRSWSDEKMIDFAISELEKMKLLDRADYLDGVVRRMEYTYPCYFGEGYEKFSLIRNHLDSIENLYCIGRNGAHRYNNQDHSMLSAMRLADMLISDNG